MMQGKKEQHEKSNGAFWMEKKEQSTQQEKTKKKKKCRPKTDALSFFDLKSTICMCFSYNYWEVKSNFVWDVF